VVDSFPNLTALRVTTKTDFMELVPLLEVIGQQLTEFAVNCRSTPCSLVPPPGTTRNLKYLFKLMPRLSKLEVLGSILSTLERRNVVLQDEWFANLTHLELDECDVYHPGVVVHILSCALKLEVC